MSRSVKFSREEEFRRFCSYRSPAGRQSYVVFEPEAKALKGSTGGNGVAESLHILAGFNKKRIFRCSRTLKFRNFGCGKGYFIYRFGYAFIILLINGYFQNRFPFAFVPGKLLNAAAFLSSYRYNRSFSGSRGGADRRLCAVRHRRGIFRNRSRKAFVQVDIHFAYVYGNRGKGRGSYNIDIVFLFPYLNGQLIAVIALSENHGKCSSGCLCGGNLNLAVLSVGSCVFTDYFLSVSGIAEGCPDRKRRLTVFDVKSIIVNVAVECLIKAQVALVCRRSCRSECKLGQISVTGCKNVCREKRQRKQNRKQQCNNFGLFHFSLLSFISF